jgi:dihydroorotate dehydrogenase electron transfer subunit
VATNCEAPLIARETVGGSYFLLTFRHRSVAQTARAGQFVMMKAGRSAEPPLRRPFSIMDVTPEQDSFRLFVKAIGLGTRGLTDLAVGDTALCLGPLGTPFAAPSREAEPVLVAGGYGIAPLLLFSHELRRQQLSPRLFYGGRTESDLALRARVEALGFPHHLATDDGSVGERGRVTEPLERYLDASRRPAALFACGPDAMLRAVATIAERRGLPAQVSLDPWMGCGFGVCLSCVVRIQRRGEERGRYRCACTEGPVFDAADVVWPDEAVSRSQRQETGA